MLKLKTHSVFFFHVVRGHNKANRMGEIEQIFEIRINTEVESQSPLLRVKNCRARRTKSRSLF